MRTRRPWRPTSLRRGPAREGQGASGSRRPERGFCPVSYRSEPDCPAEISAQCEFFPYPCLHKSPDTACGRGVDSRPDRSAVPEFVWRGDTESSAPGESTLYARRRSIEQSRAATDEDAETQQRQRSLALPYFNGKGLEIVPFLGSFGRFRNHRPDFRRRSPFLSSPLLRLAYGFLHDAALLQDVGEERALGRVDLPLSRSRLRAASNSHRAMGG